MNDRVRTAFRSALLFTAIYVVGAALILFFLRGPIAALFQATDEATVLIYLFCGPLALAYFFNGSLFVANAAFNNMSHPFYSTWLNWGRHTLGTIPFVIVGASWFGASGVLIGQAVGGVIFGLLAWGMAERLIATNTLKKPDEDRFRTRPLSVLHHRR